MTDLADLKRLAMAAAKEDSPRITAEWSNYYDAANPATIIKLLAVVEAARGLQEAWNMTGSLHDASKALWGALYDVREQP